MIENWDSYMIEGFKQFAKEDEDDDKLKIDPVEVEEEVQYYTYRRRILHLTQ